MQRSTTTAADIAVTIVEPRDSNGIVMFALPGGGMTRRYYDLDGADADGTLSMAEHLAVQGFTVIALDHPGVGDSPGPEDGWSLTPAYVAGRDAAAVMKLRERFPGVAIGVGHSMGSMLAVMAQARHRCFDALGLLGWAYSQRYRLPELDAMLTPDEKALVASPDLTDARLVEFAKQRFDSACPPGTSTTWELLVGPVDVTDEARAAMRDSGAPLLAVCGMAAPLHVAGPLVPEIDVPVFLGFGEFDITGNARATAEEFRSSPDITVFELADSGHNHNMGRNRSRLWDRLARWATGVRLASNVGAHTDATSS